MRARTRTSLPARDRRDRPITHLPLVHLASDGDYRPDALITGDKRIPHRPWHLVPKSPSLRAGADHRIVGAELNLARCRIRYRERPNGNLTDSCEHNGVCRHRAADSELLEHVFEVLFHRACGRAFVPLDDRARDPLVIAECHVYPTNPRP
jgi:hypothetical protein